MNDLKLPPTGITQPEANWLVEQAAALPEDAIIVHIGVAHGASLLCSRAGNEEARLVGIDTRLDRLPLADGLDTVEMVEADSRTVDFEDEVDWLFVDGDHSEGSVWADILNWHHRIVEGGVMAFHDYGNHKLRWCQGVKAAVDKWDWSEWQEVEAPGSIRAFRKGAA